ncbi:hypothetical protein BGX30_007972 [Mortierella sp. GBA39]|nr:hypothetical protein BGX30_007972 [Mortierella sp. GBA39]
MQYLNPKILILFKARTKCIQVFEPESYLQQDDQQCWKLQSSSAMVVAFSAGTSAAMSMRKFSNENRLENMPYEQKHDYVPEAARISVFQRLRWCQDKFENKEDWQSDYDSLDFEAADKEDGTDDEQE